MKKCPNCGLINPDSAVKCDCEYNFQTENEVYAGDKRRKNMFVISILAFILTSYYFVCTAPSYKMENLSKKNPTKYVFNSGYTNVSNAIKNVFPEFDYHKGVINVEGSNIDINHEDFYSVRINGESISYIYRFRDEPNIPFYAVYDIYSDSLGINKTMVKVICKRYTLYLGETFLSPLFQPLGHAFFHTKNVEGTTIEEYEILLKIGQYLNEKNMPELVLPKV